MIVSLPPRSVNATTTYRSPKVLPNMTKRSSSAQCDRWSDWLAGKPPLQNFGNVIVEALTLFEGCECQSLMQPST